MGSSSYSCCSALSGRSPTTPIRCRRTCWRSPSPEDAHPLGTDAVGYDVLGRLMLGGQSTLEVGLAAALLATFVGTSWGAVAGFVGGWVDALMMRIVNSWLAVPPLLLVLLLASIFTPTIPI